MIEFGTSTIASIITYVKDIWADFLPLTLLLIGLFLGVFLIEKIISSIFKEK